MSSVPRSRSWPASTGASAPASAGSCSGRTDRERRRCCAWRRSTSIPRAVRSRCSASGSGGSTCAGCAPASASSARPSPTCCAPTSPRSTPSCPPGRRRSRPGGTATAPTTTTTRSTCWGAWAPRPSPPGRSARSPPASASGCCSPARSGATRVSSCSTSPPPDSTSGPAKTSSPASPTSPPTRPRRRPCSSPTTWRRSRVASPTRCCSGRGGRGGRADRGRPHRTGPLRRVRPGARPRPPGRALRGASQHRRTRRPLRRGPTSHPGVAAGPSAALGCQAPATSASRRGRERTISSASRRSISGPTSEPP